MVPFKLGDVQDHQGLDWQILQNGAISLYFDQTVLDESLAWFHEHAYRIYDFECSPWKSIYDCYDVLAQGLALTDFCTGSLDALRDCLADIDVPYAGGSVLLFRQFGGFALKHWEFAQQLLDIIQDTSRLFSLHGYRLIALVQLHDPKIIFERVGACPVDLNPLERRTRFREQLKQAQKRLAQKRTKKQYKKSVWENEDESSSH
jgi:RNAse (barnase) inhibitor barstar